MLLLPAASCLAQEDTAGTNERASRFGGIPTLPQIESPSLNVGSAELQYPHRFQAGQHYAVATGTSSRVGIKEWTW
jgi:hypothetical protein